MGCPICDDGEANTRGDFSRDVQQVACLQCGNYTISHKAVVNLRSVDISQRWKISAWVNEFNPPIFDADELEVAIRARPPGLLYRAERMLRRLKHDLGPGVNDFAAAWGYERYIAVGWNRNSGEARYMIEEVLIKELGYLENLGSPTLRVTPKGLIFLEGLTLREARTGFCAMWFSDEVTPLWTKAIEPAIQSAGYESLRIDGKHHNGKIDDEIMASIRSSKFIVADFTGNRGGVYYEAGFAHGLGLPVIFMCREGDDLHFDIRQYNTIFWKSDQLDQARERLKNRILATLGQGLLRNF